MPIFSQKFTLKFEIDAYIDPQKECLKDKGNKHLWFMDRLSSYP